MNISGRTLLAGAIAAAITFTMAPQPAFTAQPAAQPGDCTLSASGSVKSGDSGWGSCLQVTTTLDHAPQVGHKARLRIAVLAQRDRPDVPIEIDLRDGMRWESPPPGLSTAPATALLDTGPIPVMRASGTVSLIAGRAHTFTATVVPEKEGYTEIRARAGVMEPHLGADAVYLTVGTQSSRFGYHNPEAQRVSPVPDGTTITPATPRIPFQPLARNRLATPSSDDEKGEPGVLVLACVSGRWVYIEGGNTRPSRNFQVQVWDEDPGRDDLLGVGLTDGDGRYRVCFDNNDGPFGRGQDVYLHFVADNGQWNVEREEDEPFTFNTNTINNVGNGTTTDFGTLQPTDNALHRGLHAFDAANDASAWTPGDCWDARDTECTMIHIRWAPDSTVGGFYCPTDDFTNCDADNTVRLLPDHPNEPPLVAHEVGHGVMDDIFEDAFPSFDNCQNHQPDQARSEGCAWVEGFADWYAITVYGQTAYRGWELEARQWGDGWANGHTVEGRVAGALNDIADAHNAAPGNNETWDRYTEPAPGRLWETLLNHRSNTFREFWNNRVSDGFDTAPERALGCLFQNTIDYDFRDPIGDGTIFQRPQAFTAHNYRIDTTRIFWSVVATRSAATNDHDLALYDDFGQTQLLEASVAVEPIDFVAIDSNAGRRPIGDYYPRVTLASGTGGYEIQYAQAVILDGNAAIPMQATDVVAVRDVFLTEGTPVTITVTPSDPSQDAELFILESLDNPDTWTQRRTTAAASSTGNGPGAAEQVTYTPPRTGFFAIVVTNRAGAGTYTVHLG